MIICNASNIFFTTFWFIFLYFLFVSFCFFFFCFGWYHRHSIMTHIFEFVVYEWALGIEAYICITMFDWNLKINFMYLRLSIFFFIFRIIGNQMASDQVAVLNYYGYNKICILVSRTIFFSFAICSVKKPVRKFLSLYVCACVDFISIVLKN